jgi:glycosyltransferase involved in cell wall biosynthesis
MACEVPVISSNGGGLPEVNIHGVTGYLSDPGNVSEMANFAIKILSDDSTLGEFRANAYAQARRFDINNILPDYEACYQEVIQRSVNKVE